MRSPGILPATSPCAAAVLSIVRSGLPNTPAGLPKALSILPIDLVVHSCGVSVVLDDVAVGSWGREASIAVRAGALYHLAVDSETAAVDACRPSAGSEVPVPHASDVDNRSVAADNWFGAPPIQVETTNILVGVAAADLGVASDDLWKAAVGSGARANYPRSVAADPGLLQKGKAVVDAPASRTVKGVGVILDWLHVSPY